MNQRDDRPAMAGGMKAKRVPYSRARRYGDEELRELKEAIDSGTLFYAYGKKVQRLEESFAASCDLPHGIACSSGTAAIHAALAALEVSPDDEVITSPITDMGTLSPILFQGAVPIFADLELDNGAMNPRSVAEQVTSRTRAVIAVHLGGNACDLASLSDLCRDRGIALVEDCAQSMGCTYREQPIGSIGDVGCFSLNEYKHISCGDGGMVVTRDDDLAARLRLSTDKCYDRRPGASERNPTFLASNYRMTELQGAVALAQLEKLPDIVARRRAWCEGLTERIRDLEGTYPMVPTEGCNPSWWFYLLRVEPDELGASAEEFASGLSAEGVPAGARYIGRPVYEYPIFSKHSAFARGSHPYERQEYARGLCPQAERLLETCILISVNEAYSTVDLEETSFAVRRLAAWFQARTRQPEPVGAAG